MLRTRDLFLFVLVVFFLLLVMVFTVSNDRANRDAVSHVDFSEQEISTPTVIYEEKELDRKSIITRLREAIKDEKVTLLESEPEPEVVQADSPGSAPACSMNNGLNLARTWPHGGVVVREVEGVRQVAEVVNEVINPLLILPLNPSVSGSENCLKSQIVGVTVTGGLLFNTDAIVYKTKSAGDLVGYARDGYPIYGNYAGEVDVCGGSNASGQYRYYLNSGSNKVLGCYHGQPRQFVGE